VAVAQGVAQRSKRRAHRGGGEAARGAGRPEVPQRRCRGRRHRLRRHWPATRKLLTASGVAKSLGGRELFSDVDLLLTPGTKLGLLGPNGSGKSTLLRVLAGEVAPDAGAVTRADDLRSVMFEQGRVSLDPAAPLRRALCPNGETVLVGGRPWHVVAWAKRFLFRAEQLDMPLGDLSGGEQARVRIAQLMLQPADLLLLDEPTNDLDIPALEVLEESLADFLPLVLVSHDRDLMDRLCTEVVGLTVAVEQRSTPASDSG
jgi:ATP-binding cassette subfamily F protein uup